MSDHGHAGAAPGHGDHSYEYHGEATDEPGPGEPVTPGWLTLLGITLVLAVMLAVVATGSGGKTRAELTPPGASATAAAPVPSAAPNNARVRPLASGMVRPGGLPAALGSALGRPGMSAMPRLPRPPGQFAVTPGGPGGPGAAPTPRRPPPSQPPVPQ